MLVLVGCAIIAAFAYLFWERFHTSIATGYSWLRVIQFSPFLILNNIWSAVAGGVILLAGGGVFFAKKAYAKYGLWAVILGGFLIAAYVVGNVFFSWFFFFKDSEKSLIRWSHLSKSSLYSNLFTFVVCLVPFAVWIVRRSLNTNPTNHKHFARAKDYTLHSFTDRMAEVYPHLALFRKLDLNAKPINSGKYRMADTEKQFAMKHHLLDRVKANEFKVNRDRAVQVFVNQMTRLWTGYNALTRWEQAVIAVLVPRIAATDPKMSDADYKEALQRTDDLLAAYWRDAAATYNEEKDTLSLDMKLARATIKKYGHSAKVKQFFKAHAYVGTILYSMLVEARTLGVLQPAEFRWLRVVDRRLWLIIDNVGKIVATTEVAATYAHYLHELKQKRAIEKPMIEGAVRALIEAVESYAFSPDEIAEVNHLLSEQEAAQTIDLEATAKERKNLVLMLQTVGVGADRDLFEVAVMGETGDVVYQQRCKPKVAIDAETKERYQLTDAVLQALPSLPSADELRLKLLEVCNGHNVITFEKSDLALIPGMERSAAAIGQCRSEDGEFDLSATAILEGVIEEHEVKPIRDAVSAAKLCLAIWVSQQKAALEAQAKSNKGA